MRIEIAPEAAMSPGLAAPRDHSHSVAPISSTGSTPAAVISASRKPEASQPNSAARSR